MQKFKYLAVTLGCAMLIGCAKQEQPDNSLYYWGNYSDVVYAYYNEPGDFGKQEQDLNQIITEAKNKSKQVAPGIYGHLGLVLLKQGKTSEAKRALQEEQRLYPESATFMQYLQHKK